MTYLKVLMTLALSDETRYLKTHPKFTHLDRWPIARKRLILAAREFAQEEAIGHSSVIRLFLFWEGIAFDEMIDILDKEYLELSMFNEPEFQVTLDFCDRVMRFFTRAMTRFDDSNYTKWMSFPPGDLDIHKDLFNAPPSRTLYVSPDDPDAPF